MTSVPGWFSLHGELSAEATTGHLPPALLAGHGRRVGMVEELVKAAREIQAATTERAMTGREALCQAVAKAGDPYGA